jgi:hypothetical protein
VHVPPELSAAEVARLVNHYRGTLSKTPQKTMANTTASSGPVSSFTISTAAPLIPNRGWLPQYANPAGVWRGTTSGPQRVFFWAPGSATPQGPLHESYFELDFLAHDSNHHLVDCRFTGDGVTPLGPASFYAIDYDVHGQGGGYTQRGPLQSGHALFIATEKAVLVGLISNTEFAQLYEMIDCTVTPVDIN